MPTLDTLPAELILRIVVCLPLQTLRNLRLVSRSWHDFFCEHESTIYHHAALLHNFIDSIHTLLPEAKAAHPLKFLQDVPDWREYCALSPRCLFTYVTATILTPALPTQADCISNFNEIGSVEEPQRQNFTVAILTMCTALKWMRNTEY